MTVILILGVVAGLVLIAGRYGADSRTGADPTGRDPAWPAHPGRDHSPRADLRLLRALAGAWAAQVRAERVLDRHQRPWENARCRDLTPRW